MNFRTIFVAGLLLTPVPAYSQNFNQFVAFGDSSVDSGWFRYSTIGSPFFDARIAAAVANGATGGWAGPAVVNPQLLSARFGLLADPANRPGGGTNYAIGGGLIAQFNGIGNNIATAAGSAAADTQINNYLASNGGRANPNALYVFSSGGNDVRFANDPANGFLTDAARQAFIAGQIARATTSIQRLQAAGARNIVVYNSYGASTTNAFSNLWPSLSQAGVNFIPADIFSVTAFVRANPARFGFTPATVLPGVVGAGTGSACVTALGSPPTTSGWGLVCANTTTPTNQFAYLRSADAQQTSLFADDLHLSQAGHRIVSDYVYSLIVAPSQISFLAENAIQFRRGITGGIQDQIDVSQRRRVSGFNVWFNGDVSSLRLNNSSNGFPSDPSTPVSGTLGVNYTFANSFLLGGAITVGSQDPSFSSGGGFKEREVAGSLYGAMRAGPVWGNAILTYGYIDFDVNRIVPIGISFDSNNAKTHGGNASFAALAGYDFKFGAFTVAPVAGVEIQSVRVNSFAETGAFTNLAFSNIGRESIVSALGVRASLDYGVWRPFVQATWNHEIENTRNRTVTATLLSTAAPSYSLPIVQFGRDWASATAGTTLDLGSGLTGIAAITGQLGQNRVTNYGGRFGLNYAFGPASPPAKL